MDNLTLNDGISTPWRQFTALRSHLPHCCLLCEQALKTPSTPLSCLICPSCEALLPKAEFACKRCALPMEIDLPLCGECLKTPPHFDHTVACFIYSPPVDQLIKGFKQHRQWLVGRLLGLCLAATLRHYYYHEHHEQASMPDMIVPMPLHWRRQWSRGFNQAAFLARLLAASFDCPVVNGLKRKPTSLEQKQLTKPQRLKHLTNAILINQPLWPTKSYSLQGKHIALVDDVMTTGATANAAAAILKKAGAARVSVWVVARTPIG